MAVIKVTSEEFKKEVLESDRPVIVDFYADWCGPCKMLAPGLEKISEENDEYKIVKVNINDDEDLAREYRILSIPTLVGIKNGKEVNRLMGLQQKQEILDIFK